MRESAGIGISILKDESLKKAYLGGLVYSSD